jgi:hypothetical protein
MQDKDLMVTSPFRCSPVELRLEKQQLKNEATDGLKGDFSSEEDGSTTLLE